MNFIEVCAGCGGLSSGLIKAGLTPLLLNDLDRDACETLRRNHPDIDIRCSSVETLHLHDFVDRVDLLAGGIPCQSFSYAGKQKGLDDPRGGLFLHFVRLVDECNPKMFLIENVKGLRSNDKGATLERIENLLTLDGRYVIQHEVLNAKHFHVPQHRERIFIVGIRSDFAEIPFAFPMMDPTRLIIPLKDALKDVPDSDGFEYSEKKKAMFAFIPPGGCWVDLPEHLKLEYMGEKTLHAGGGKRGILRRLHMDQPSLTLLCTPSQKQTERCHPVYDRPLRVREYARIQTFPDEYIFCGSISSQYRQIGNAVPVELARHVGVAIQEFFKKKNEEYPRYRLKQISE